MRIRPGLKAPLRFRISFRELRQQARRERAERKLEALQEDETSVFSSDIEFDELIRADISRDETLHLLMTSNRLTNDVRRLIDALDTSTGNINALWRMIESITTIARFMGAHPLQRRLNTKPAKEKRAQKNEHWVQPFNKAIGRAHSAGLTGTAAIKEACNNLKRDGVKIPVGSDALRRRERELRTGKKRTK
jgi:hypothetical protein